MDPGKYVDQMEEAYIQHFKTKPVQKHRFHYKKVAIQKWTQHISSRMMKKKYIGHF